MPIFRGIEEGRADKNYNWPEMEDISLTLTFNIFFRYIILRKRDMAEFDAACARFQDLRGDFKSLHRMKFDLYIEGIESGIRSDYKFANMKRNSSG
jgi:hypothetical protein